jgi:hypothetical protein
MNLLRVLLRSVCGSHPSDVPPKSKISVQIEQNGNGRRSGAFLHISFKNSSICKAFGVRQRPPQGAEFVCVPCGANNSKSSAARRAGSSPATGTTASEEASTVPFPPRGENCTMLAFSTYDGYSVSFGEGEWKNGERGKEHLPPDPSYKMSWEPVIGAGLVVICTVGIIAVAADDLTGVGVADDFLFGLLGAGVGEGLIMIFG